MKNLILFVILIALFGCIQPDHSPFLEQVKILQENGQFTESERLINSYLKSDEIEIDQKTRAKLLFEIERQQRILNDYRLTEEDVFSQVQNRINEVSREEFELWQQENKFDIKIINGEKRFANPSVSNLFFKYPDIRVRRKNYTTEDSGARLLWAHYQQVKELSQKYPDPVLNPRTGRVVQYIRVAPGKVPAGERLKCWLPLPGLYETQHNVRLLNTSQTPQWIAHPSSTIRSVYMETDAAEDGSAEFKIEYEYTAYSYYGKVDPQKVIPFSGSEYVYRQFTREEYPHEVFSMEMRKLAKKIIGAETNPYLKGKLIYEWIGDNIKYSYAREYSTLRNISQYCLEEGRGDCGQEAILFITLARIAGVPARWQSGFFTFPNDEGMHDWAEIYIKPYGWMPVDPYMSIYWTSMTDDLTPEQRMEMRDFYYGGIDHFRMVANKAHNQRLYPAKQHFRSETVDFQRGEVEWSGGNLFFTDWNWGFSLQEIKREDI